MYRERLGKLMDYFVRLSILDVPKKMEKASG